MKNLMLIHAKNDTAKEEQKIEISLIEKAKTTGEINNSATAEDLCAGGAIAFLGMTALWISTGGAFDFEKAVRASLEACFDVKGALRCGESLSAIISRGVG
jgi:hypothetical protein